MRLQLSAAKCYALAKKHSIPLTGYIKPEALFAAFREAHQSGVDVDTVHIKYKKPKNIEDQPQK